MPAIETWIRERRQWKKCYLGKTYLISTRQLRKLGLPCDDTEQGSSQSVNLWWTAKKAEIDGANQIFAFDTGRKLVPVRQFPHGWEHDAKNVELLNAKGFKQDDEHFALYAPDRTLLFASSHERGYWQHAREQRETVPETQTLGVLIDKFLEDKRGTVAKDTHRSMRLSLKHVGNILGRQLDAKEFDEKSFATVSLAMGKLELAESTIGALFSKFKSFVRWLYDTATVIDSLPRNFNKENLQHTIKGSVVKFIPVETIRMMLNAADDRTKLIILLGLSCGFTSSPISKFSKTNIDKFGRYVWRRPKTENKSDRIPTVHFKLWKEVIDLLDKVKLPKAVEDIRAAFNAVRDELGISDEFSHGSLRSTGATLIFNGEYAKYKIWYLGDVDPSIAWQHYTAKDSAEFQIGFDKCLDDLHDQILGS